MNAADITLIVTSGGTLLVVLSGAVKMIARATNLQDAVNELRQNIASAVAELKASITNVNDRVTRVEDRQWDQMSPSQRARDRDIHE